ncbi:tetratricopeptide repeat protein [Tunicatimonas pelagia]|uniref:tetratricopeptide repeat protein n=1 Tax=Tunicatimonas pelagia TaxID=931531 RepID=UPI00266607E9|nr:tetratricopeptide repeat protein [Tunicatimonas pelagia]WKN42048.1 tetratricopeptide repeat protein [Tunicatimonas pelagia]
MNTERLAQLLNFLQEEPNDPFTLYAIATEYAQDNPEQARPYYEKLLEEHPNYVATYYHVAKLYQAKGETALAEATYQKGIAVAQQQQDHLALRELQNAYNEFLFEQE